MQAEVLTCGDDIILHLRRGDVEIQLTMDRPRGLCLRSGQALTEGKPFEVAVLPSANQITEAMHKLLSAEE